jgi:hypothetical protein
MPHQLNPENPFGRIVPVFTLDPLTSLYVPATSGAPPVGFFATSEAPDATVAAADAQLQIDGVYVGNQVGRKVGDWFLFFAPTTLTRARLDPIFNVAGAKCFFIYTRPGAHRVVEPLVYVRSRRATIAA